MSRLSKLKEPWVAFFGSESEVNILGQVVLSPMLILCCVVIGLLEFLFTRDLGDNLDDSNYRDEVDEEDNLEPIRIGLYRSNWHEFEVDAIYMEIVEIGTKDVIFRYKGTDRLHSDSIEDIQKMFVYVGEK